MSYARDQAIANESNERRPLVCIAHGCPNRWSVDGGSGRLCSAHAWAPRIDWPAITQQQIDAETDRALSNAVGKYQPRAAALSHAEKTEILQRLRRIGQPEQPKAWAYALKAREEQGERLTSAQRAMWRSAIGHQDTSEWIDGAGFKGIEQDKLPESMRPRHHSRAPARFSGVVS